MAVKQITMSMPSLGVSITGSLTHVASLAVALFLLAVASGYAGQLVAEYLLFTFGILAWSFYMFLAINAYREDRSKKTKAKESTPKQALLTKVELFDMAIKAKEKYSPEDLKAIYEWINGKKD